MRTETRPPNLESEAGGSERERIVRGVRYCLWVFVAVRVGLGIVAAMGTALVPANPDAPLTVPGSGPGTIAWNAEEVTTGWHVLVTVWERFDALWFLGIATEGYVDGNGSAAFFPLYPLLIRGVSFALGGHPLAAALLISNVSFAAALIVLYFLTSSEWGEDVARRAVLYLAIFPTAYFFLAPYSEPLFLLLAVTAFWAARRGHWWAAGAAGALAAATRSVGILIAPALLAEGIHRWRELRRGGAISVSWLLRPALAAGAVGLGTGAYLLFWRLFAGDWWAPLNQQAAWQRVLTGPWETLASGTREAFRWLGQYPGGYHLLDWLLVVPALVAAGWVAIRARPGYTIYAWLSLLVPLSFIFPSRPFMSLPRFLLVVFPLIWAPAVWAGRRRGVHEAIVAVSAAGLGVMTVLFATWYFVF